MYLIVGLGNPGNEYSKTRHNAGFWFVDALAKKLTVEKVILLKSKSFMNRSGIEVAKAKNFRKIENDNVIIVSDDVNLPVGRVRIRRGGEDGGHNGLKSVVEHIGDDFWRVRIGVGDPGVKPLESYVLEKISPDDRKTIASAIDKTADKLLELLSTQNFQNITIN